MIPIFIRHRSRWPFIGANLLWLLALGALATGAVFVFVFILTAILVT